MSLSPQRSSPHRSCSQSLQGEHAASTRKEPWSRFTKAEDAFIRENVDNMSDVAIGEVLCRTAAGIKWRRSMQLQIKRGSGWNRWTLEEDLLLRALYGKVDGHYLAAMLGRAHDAMKYRACEIGLSVERTPWSKQEMQTLREHFSTLSLKLLSELLPGRSRLSISNQAVKLGLTRGPTYMLGSSRHRFWSYPPELQALIRLQKSVNRRLKDVEAKHRKPTRTPL